MKRIILIMVLVVLSLLACQWTSKVDDRHNEKNQRFDMKNNIDGYMSVYVITDKKTGVEYMVISKVNAIGIIKLSDME